MSVRTLSVVITLSLLALQTVSCRGLSRTLGTTGAVDVSAAEFIARYEEPRKPDRFWRYAGRVGDFHYMERFELVSQSYPEEVGEIRAPHAELPAGFPSVPQGRSYPDPPRAPEDPEVP